MVVRWDRDLRRIYGNPAFERIIGKPLAACSTRGRQRWRRSDGPRVRLISRRARRKFASVFATGEPHTVALARRTEHGVRTFETRFVPEHDETGALMTVLGIGRDITRLKDSEREARTLADHSPDLIARSIHKAATSASIARSPADGGSRGGVHRPPRRRGLLAAPGQAATRIRRAQRARDGGDRDQEPDRDRARDLELGGKRLWFDLRLIPELDGDG